MSDSYQAIYDAVRSRIGGGNIGDSIERVARDAFDTSELKFRAMGLLDIVGYEAVRPSVLFRPAISIDGNQWCALYGENLQDGVAGFGDSLALAMEAFDKNWNASLPKSQERNG